MVFCNFLQSYPLCFSADSLLSEVVKEERGSEGAAGKGGGGGDGGDGGGDEEEEEEEEGSSLLSGSKEGEEGGEKDKMSFQSATDPDAGLQYRLQGTFTR